MMSRCPSCAGPDDYHEPHCQQERDDLRNENARLQTALEGTVQRGVRLLKEIERLHEDLRVLNEDFSPEVWEEMLQRAEKAERERDGYKALAEWRREALEPLVPENVVCECDEGDESDRCFARAAIDATPEEAREKERR